MTERRRISPHVRPMAPVPGASVGIDTDGGLSKDLPEPAVVGKLAPGGVIVQSRPAPDHLIERSDQVIERIRIELGLQLPNPDAPTDLGPSLSDE